MLTYVFSDDRDPLYEQIYNFIKTDIMNGTLKPGEKLPSKRTFAEHNGISTITVQSAYDQLISEGYVQSVPRKGYFVADIVVPHGMRHVTEKARKEKNEADAEENFINLSDSSPDETFFPFTVWAKLLRSNLSMRQPDLMKTPPTGGVEELREAIASHLGSFRGMDVDKDSIVVGAGTEYLYGLITQLLGRGMVYGIENPGYMKLPRIYKSMGVSYRYIDMDEMGISPDGLDKAGADIAHISPNHHFPTGITMPVTRRLEVLDWVTGGNRYVIEDDYDSEFRANGKPVPTMYSMDEGQNVIYMNTFSRSLSSTIRISYMVLPEKLMERFRKELSFYSSTVSTFEQYTLAEFISRGYFEKHINRMRLHYLRSRKAALSVLAKSDLAGKYRIKENDTGLHFLLELKTKKSDEDIKERLKERGIKIRSLSDYYHDKAKAPGHFFLINYSALKESIIDKICNCLAESIKD